MAINSLLSLDAWKEGHGCRIYADHFSSIKEVLDAALHLARQVWHLSALLHKHGWGKGALLVQAMLLLLLLAGRRCETSGAAHAGARCSRRP